MKTKKQDKKNNNKLLKILVIVGVPMLLVVGWFYFSNIINRDYVSYAKKSVQGLLTDPTSAKFWGIEVVERPDALVAVCGKVDRSRGNDRAKFYRFVVYDTGKDNLWQVVLEGDENKVKMNRLYEKYCSTVKNKNVVIYSE